MAKPRMKTTEQTEVSEAQIAVHWKEEAYYQPSEKFKAQANMRDPHVFDRFGLDKFPDCFREYADMLTWFEPYHTVLDRKSTRLNSSHLVISYAVFCLKKKK